MAIYIDKAMGGRVRDKDEVNLIVDGGSDALKEYLQSLFDNATFNWSQIVGDITSNQQLIDYLNSLIDQINQNTIENGDLITNELKAYVDNLFDNLTITWEQITGSPEFNQEFKDYIDNLLENLTITWEQIIGSPVLNQELIDLLNQYKTDIQNSFADYILGETVTNELKQYIDNLLQEIRNELQELTNQTNLNTTLLTEIQQQIDEITNLITTIQAGDTITQEYKDYLEQKFTDLQTLITEITEGAVINEITQQYIDNALTELKTVLQEFIDNSIGDAITEITQEVTNEITNIIQGEATRLISGSITWIENLDFQATALVYQILNRRYNSPAQIITIPANTEANPRFAVIWGDVFGNLGYILGAAAPSPAVPHVNDSTQIALTTVYIPSLGTEPAPDPDDETGEIVTTVIYDENLEWITAATSETLGDTSVTINLEDTTDPAKGLKHISAIFTGGTAVAERGEVLLRESRTGITTITEAAEFSQVTLEISAAFPQHKTDSTTGQTRHLKYYNWSNLAQLQPRFKSKTTGQVFAAELLSVISEVWAIPEIGFSVTIPKTITVKVGQTIFGVSYPPALPADEYELILYFADLYDQQYIINTEAAAFIEPATAQIEFTNNLPAPVSIKDGKISFSISTNEAWLTATGFLMKLLNGAEQIGSLAFLPGHFYGFNPKNTFYQRVTIPIADFNPTSDEITGLIIKPVNSWPNSVLNIDNIVLQTGLEEPAPDHIEDMNFEYRDIPDGDEIYTIDPDASFNYRVKEMVIFANVGEVTLAAKINGTPIAGLTFTATATKQTIVSIADNSLIKGDVLTLEIISTANEATAIVGKFRYIRL